MTEWNGFKGAAKRLDDIDIPRIGHRIGVGEDEIHAFMDVEAAGSGFDSQGRPRILFEPHVFYRNVPAALRQRAVSAGLAYARWGMRPYPKDSYPRLLAAMEIDETAALKSASWGLGQILGENHKMIGYDTPQAMVVAFMEDEENHLAGMVDFLIAAKIDDDLRAHRWAKVAEVYNGPGYRKNNYDGRLSAAFARWRKIKDTPWTPGDVTVTDITVITGPVTTKVWRWHIAGDSFGEGLAARLGGMSADFKRGTPSADIIHRVRAADGVIIGAGSNDVSEDRKSINPEARANLEAIRARAVELNPNVEIIWVLPVIPIARDLVKSIAELHGDDYVAVAAGPDGVHPPAWGPVARDVMAAVQKIEAGAQPTPAPASQPSPTSETAAMTTPTPAPFADLLHTIGSTALNGLMGSNPAMMVAGNLIKAALDKPNVPIEVKDVPAAAAEVVAAIKADPKVAIVATKSAWMSKINWAQAAGLAATVAAIVGLPLSAEQILGVVAGIQTVVATGTWILKTFFTPTVTPASIGK